MPTRSLKLAGLGFVLLVILAGCARRQTLELPPPIIQADASQGWHSY